MDRAWNLYGGWVMQRLRPLGTLGSGTLLAYPLPEVAVPVCSSQPRGAGGVRSEGDIRVTLLDSNYLGNGDSILIGRPEVTRQGMGQSMDHLVSIAFSQISQ